MEAASLASPREVEAVRKTELMSLPCGNGPDSRSIPVITLSEKDRVDVCGSIVNTRGETWYEVDFFGDNCYVPAEDVQDPPPTLWEKIKTFFTGK